MRAEITGTFGLVDPPHRRSRFATEPLTGTSTERSSAVSPSSTTPLAEAQISRSTHDVVTVELVEPDGLPAKVRITWPEHPSLIDPKAFPDTAATIAQLFARAHIVLAAIKAWKRPL
jgi:hypothetical protein